MKKIIYFIFCVFFSLTMCSCGAPQKNDSYSSDPVLLGDIKTIEENITLISETLKEGENLKNSFNTLYTKLDSDVKTVTQITSEIEKAIQRSPLLTWRLN